MAIKLLALVHGYYSSHTVRPLELAKALRETGKYDITFSGEGEYMKSLVEPAGFKWVKTEAFPKRKILDLIEDHLVPRIFDYETAEKFYKIEDELLKEQKPDIILRDMFRELAGIASKAQEKPIFDVFIQKASCCPYYHMDFRPKHFPWIIDKIVPKKIMQTIGPFLQDQFRNWIFRPLYNQVKKHNIPINKNVPEGYEADLVFFPDEEKFFPFKNMRDNYRHLGAILFEDKSLAPAWLEDFVKDPRKKILVTAGLSGEQERKELFKEVFKDNKYTVAFHSTKNNGSEDFYGNDDFNICKVLPHADLFIHHGGTGSNYQGLKLGIPMLALPNHFEQQINGAQLEKTGAGLSFYPFDINPKNVRKKVEDILSNPSFKENAVAFSRTITKNPLESAVKCISGGYERFKQEHNLK